MTTSVTSRPAGPTATVPAHLAASRPATGGPRPVAAAVGAVRAILSGSPGRLRLVGALAIIAALLIAVLGTAAMRSRSAALAAAQEDAAQLVRIQTIQTNLRQADADATNAYLVAGLEPPAQRADYQASLTVASTTIAEAAMANPADAATLGTVNDIVVRYAGDIEAARANNRAGKPVGTAYLREASGLLRLQALPALSRLADANSARVRTSYSHSTWAGWVLWGVGLAGLGVLVWAQVWLARRTHRYLNLPIAAGTLGVLLALVAGVAVMWQAQSRAEAVRTGSYANTAALTQARISAFDAKAYEGGQLVNRGGGSLLEPAFEVSAATAQKELASLDPGVAARAGSSTPDLGLNAWLAIHPKIRVRDEAGDWDGAVALAVGTKPDQSNGAFAVFATQSARALAQQDATATAGLKAAGDRVHVWSWLLLVVGVIAAGAIWWGISTRLDEYR